MLLCGPAPCCPSCSVFQPLSPLASCFLLCAGLRTPQLTLMDANYVMDETLGTASFDISAIQVGQTETQHFLIGKVGHHSVIIWFYLASLSLFYHLFSLLEPNLL